MEFLAASESEVISIRQSSLEAAIARATGELQSAFSICRKPETMAEWYEMVKNLWADKAEFLYHSVYLNPYINKKLLGYCHMEVARLETVWDAAVRFAQEAYRSYQKRLGQPDEWDLLPEPVKHAWICAAEAVEYRALREYV